LRNKANFAHLAVLLEFAEVGEAFVEATVGGDVIAHEETEFLREEVVRHFVDEDFLGRADGLMVVAQGLEESLDFLVGLVLKKREVGAEAVTEGVLSDSDLADFDLGLGGHGGSSYSEKLVIAGVFRSARKGY